MIAVGISLHEGSAAVEFYPAVKSGNRRFVGETGKVIQPFFGVEFFGKIVHRALCDTEFCFIAYR
jgi:hypothetical protein